MNFKKIITCVVLVILQIQQMSAMAQTYPAGACKVVPGSKTCVDKTPCKTMSNGMIACIAGASLPTGAAQLPQTCWKYSYTYTCEDSGNNVDTCTTAPWWNPKTCSIVSRSCQNTRPEDGKCTSYNYTYSCVTSPATTTEQTVCGNNLDNTKYDKPDNQNGNLFKAVTAMEIARESQVYSDGNSRPIFIGKQESCKKGYFGLKNCCNSMPAGPASNSAVMSAAFTISGKVVMYAGKQAVDVASPYVFDALFEGVSSAAGLANSFGSVAEGAGSSLSSLAQSIPFEGTTFASSGISAYGFTYGAAGSAGAAGGGLLDGNIAIDIGATGLEGTLVFNPYAFAAAVVIQFAIQALMQALQCTEQEQILGMHKGANLSVFIKEECTNKIPIINVCLEYTDTYCSFNSILAKIVNQQGKAQLGLNFNDCSGIRLDQVAKLDFNKIDFHEFSAQVQDQAMKNVPSTAEIKQGYTPIMNTINNGTNQSTTNGTAYPKK